MHEIGRIVAVTPEPSQETVSAWKRLVRVQQTLLTAIEAELKRAGLPPLAWYDALWELVRAPDGKLRPLELERTMLLPQYSTSRLVERLVKAGLVEREACPVDGRGQMIAITVPGRALQKKMWATYAAAIERHVGSKLSNDDADRLYALLGKLGE